MVRTHANSNPPAAATPTLLVFADDWGRHPSSCQHLIGRLRDHYRILWANSIGTRQVRMNSFTLRRGLEKLNSWRKGVTPAGEHMCVLDLPMLPSFASSLVRGINQRIVTRRIARVLNRLGWDDPIVITTLPYAADLVRNLPRQGLVYYCTDDFSHWPGADRVALQCAEQETISRANMVLAVSEVLQARFADHRSCHYFPHGVDWEHFAAVQRCAAPREMDNLPRPRIGFFGLIYEKLDFELLAAVARRNSNGSLVLLGPQVFCPDWFRSLRNVHFLGPKPYAELPQWLAGLDVLLLPYLNDEMIRQSDPLKLRECLATGRPTVSIDIPEVRRYQPWVRVAATRDAFVQQVEQATLENGDAGTVQSRQRSVAGDGWDRRAARLRQWLSTMSTANGNLKPS
jgi:glycosyltransferase involved in cell wall biosynthesis